MKHAYRADEFPLEERHGVRSRTQSTLHACCFGKHPSVWAEVNASDTKQGHEAYVHTLPENPWAAAWIVAFFGGIHEGVTFGRSA